MPETRRDVSLVNVAPDGVRLVFEDDADGLLRFVEILARVDAHERTRRTILLTGEGRALCALRIERRVLTEIAFDREQVLRVCDSRRHLRLCETEPRFEFASDARRCGENWFTRNHRDGVVRTLRRAIAAADAGLRIDVYLSFGEATDSSCWTTRQTFRVLTMKTD